MSLLIFSSIHNQQQNLLELEKLTYLFSNLKKQLLMKLKNMIIFKCQWQSFQKLQDEQLIKSMKLGKLNLWKDQRKRWLKIQLYIDITYKKRPKKSTKPGLRKKILLYLQKEILLMIFIMETITISQQTTKDIKIWLQKFKY